MQYYKDLFDKKMEIVHKSSYYGEYLTSNSPRAMRYDLPRSDFSESKDLSFGQNLEFGQPQREQL